MGLTMQHDEFASTDLDRPARERVFILYEAGSGRVVHVHHELSFPDAPEFDEGPEDRVRRLAGATDHHRLIEVAPADIQEHPLRVDVETGRIVETAPAQGARDRPGGSAASG